MGHHDTWTWPRAAAAIDRAVILAARVFAGRSRLQVGLYVARDIRFPAAARGNAFLLRTDLSHVEQHYPHWSNDADQQSDRDVDPPHRSASRSFGAK